MNIVRFSSLSAAVVLATMSGLCTAHTTTLAVSAQPQVSTQQASGSTNAGIATGSSVEASTTVKQGGGQNAEAATEASQPAAANWTTTTGLTQNLNQSLAAQSDRLQSQGAATVAALVKSSAQLVPKGDAMTQEGLPTEAATALPEFTLASAPATLAEGSSVTQQSSAALSTAMSLSDKALSTSTTALSVTEAVTEPDLSALPAQANQSAQAAIAQSTNTLVQQQVNTELSKAVDDTIKTEVANSVQSSLNSVLSLGL